jgi:hypothetical protein
MVTKNPKYKHHPHLPKAEMIYEKEFHFLDQTLLEIEERRNIRIKKKEEKQKGKFKKD